jgi:hypothetical protein
MTKWMIAAAVAGVFAVVSASAETFIVNGNNLDNTSTTEGVKNSTSFTYYQGFSTGPTGDISQLTVDLSLCANSSGVNQVTSGSDTATFYLYSYSPGDLGSQIGGAIATVTAAEITSAGTLKTLVNVSGGYENIYQYNLISSLSTIDLTANTDYAIVMITSSGTTNIGWAESNTPATGDEGELDTVNDGASQSSGAYAQMELGINGTSVPDSSSTALLLGGVLSILCFARRRLV